MKIKSLFFLLLLLINFIPASPVYAGDIIKFGLHQNPPLNFTDADGHVKGFVIDILEYVASQEGWQIEYVPCDGPQCLKQLAAGEIDLMGAIAYSEKRTEQYDFNSETLITNWGQIYIHPGSDINSILDLEGKKIALIKKGIHSIALHKMLESFKINGIFVEVPDFPAIFNLIDRGEADAGAVNRLFAIQNEGKYNVKGLPIIFNPIEIRFAVTKNRHPDLLAALDNHLEKLKADRGSVYYQSLNKWFRIEHKPALSDRLKWVLGSTIGLIILFIGISILLKLQVRSRTRNLAVEIAEHKKAEDVLRESEERHRLLVESSSDSILVLDVDRKIVSCNRAFLALFGYDLSEVIGQSTSMIHTSAESYRSFGDAAYLEIKRSDSFRTEWEFLRRGGAVFPAETTTSAIKSQEGETTGYVAIIRDITERKKAEETLQRAKEKTELANRAKSEFLANMSHEIRTPMNSVIGFTDMLIDTDLNEEQKNYAETIKSSGETLLFLINDILDFSKIEAGELDFEAVDFDPGLLAYDICNAIRPRVGSKPVEIICHIGDDLPAYVKGDPGRFRQVLTNLMSNASKFTDKGEIELSLNAETERNDRIRLHAKVRDTGIGISEEKLSTIFEPFHQADGSTTRKYGGTGLGLSICKQISKLMDGDIWVESEVDKGSIFHFTAWFEKTEKKETKRFIPLSLSGKKALILDDNQRNLDILAHILKSAGMDVVALQNGEKVIPTFKDAKKTGSSFDLCILDIQMPVISGYDVAREIRSWERQRQKAKDSKRRIPLIALSSLMQRDAKKCKEAGFDAFLSKPFHREKLFQMLERMVAGREYEDVSENAVRDKIITQYSIREEMKHSVRILLAEDNPVNQKLATMMLTKAGYQVEVAVNGREAVEKYMATPEDFDLIFMDVQMPEMDGIAATREIRNLQSVSLKANQAQTRNIPIVAMTAHAMKGDMEICLEAGMDDYITKPIKREIVLGILEKWVFKRDRK